MFLFSHSLAAFRSLFSRVKHDEREWNPSSCCADAPFTAFLFSKVGWWSLEEFSLSFILLVIGSRNTNVRYNPWRGEWKCIYIYRVSKTTQKEWGLSASETEEKSNLWLDFIAFRSRSLIWHDPCWFSSEPSTMWTERIHFSSVGR